MRTAIAIIVPFSHDLRFITTINSILGTRHVLSDDVPPNPIVKSLLLELVILAGESALGQVTTQCNDWSKQEVCSGM